jgi:glycerol transport system ATP-binding protein
VARIELLNLAHSYHPNPTGPAALALNPMNLTWQDGGAYALLGPSGCGKTTLLNIISGLIRPSQGRVLFNGREVTTLPPEARNIAQVFQFPVIYDTMSVFDNLAFPLRNRGLKGAEVRKRVQQVAELLELTPDLKYRASGLSADAKQKISLGRGLVRHDVAAILFDEPLTVIDPHLKWLLRRKLKQIHQEYKLTLIYVTHDQVEALTFADQVVVMVSGSVVQMDSPQVLFEEPAHTFVGYFIGSPGMNLIPCNFASGAAHIGHQAVPLEPGLAAALQQRLGAKTPSQTSLTLGIRPEFLRCGAPHDPAPPGSLEAEITSVEDLGNFKLAAVRLGEQTLKAKLAEDAALTPGPGWLYFPPQRTKLYLEQHLVRAAKTDTALRDTALQEVYETHQP